MAKRCAISVDLDETPNYFSLHGLPAPGGPAASAVYDLALARFSRWAAACGVPLTFFAVGADLARGESATALGALAAEGHEVGNHSFSHHYDLTRRPRAEMAHELASASDAIEKATGRRPKGFRAPGYVVNDDLVDVASELGFAYDSSVFPCPSYYLAKVAVRAVIAVRGRRSASIVDDPRVLSAPRRPYRVGRPYWREGGGLMEIPITVTRRARLPFIGTALTIAPACLLDALVEGVANEDAINLELHGVDALDARDAGLAPLGRVQPGLAVPAEVKLGRLRRAVESLGRRGFSFVTLADLAPCS